MIVLFLFSQLTFFVFCTKGQIYDCPNYKTVKANNAPSNEESDVDNFLKSPIKFKCDLSLQKPKKIINPYKDDLKNLVPVKPLASVCLKCSMCLAIAKEVTVNCIIKYHYIQSLLKFDKIFKLISQDNAESNQEYTNQIINEEITSLCTNGFMKYVFDGQFIK